MHGHQVNSLPVVAIVGHWLTEQFEYRQKVPEFTELQCAHSGENLAATVENCLVELDLVTKLLYYGRQCRGQRVNVPDLYHRLLSADWTPLGEGRNGPTLPEIYPLPGPHH
jgi:hypothetical protein